MHNTVAVILAAGSGSRMDSDTKKQFMTIHGATVLERSVRAFLESDLVASLVVVVGEEDIEATERLLSFVNKPIRVVSGGKTRAESARCGYLALPVGAEYIAIHDAARCLVTREDINSVILSAYEHGAATAATRLTDTVKETDWGADIVRTLPRETLWRAATPQVFLCEEYGRALDAALDLSGITDDNMLLERIGVRVRCVETSAENIKITGNTDALLAEFIISRREERRNV